MMIDALLINPRISGNDKYPPLGLIYLAAYAEQEGFHVDICDAAALEMSDEEVLDIIRQFGPRCVGITFMTPQYSFALMLAGIIRKTFPGIFLIAGGIHPNVVPEDTLRRIPFLDCIVMGEGEITFVELLSALRTGKAGKISEIPGLAFMDKGKFITTTPRPLISNLDILPMPAWGKLPIQQYKVSQPTRRYEYSKGIALTISSSRGCPYRCIFCCAHGVFGSGYRYRSPRLVADEIEHIVRNYNIRHFFFVDEVLFQRRDHILTLAREIINRGLDICWAGNSRVNSPALDEEVLESVAKAGCVRIDFGVESGSPSIIKEIRKGITLSRIYESHSKVQRCGLATTTLMMIGHPSESMEDIRASIRLIAYLESDYPEFGPVTPFPGTPLYELVKETGWLRSDDWSDYFISNSYRVMRNRHFNYGEVHRLNVLCNQIARIFSQLAAAKRYLPKVTGNIISCVRLFRGIIGNRYRSYFEEDFTIKKRAEIIEMYLTKDADQKRFEELLAALSLNDLHKLNLPSNVMLEEVLPTWEKMYRRILIVPATNFGAYFSLLKKLASLPALSDIGIISVRGAVDIIDLIDVPAFKIKNLSVEHNNIVENINKFGDKYDAVVVPCLSFKKSLYAKLILKILAMKKSNRPVFLISLGTGGNVIKVQWNSLIKEVLIRIKRINESLFIEPIFSIAHAIRLSRIAIRLSSFNRKTDIPVCERRYGR